jgi:hypothetical protein
VWLNVELFTSDPHPIPFEVSDRIRHLFKVYFRISNQKNKEVIFAQPVEITQLEASMRALLWISNGFQCGSGSSFFYLNADLDPGSQTYTDNADRDPDQTFPSPNLKFLHKKYRRLFERLEIRFIFPDFGKFS